MYGKELRWLITKNKYGKVRDIEIKWLIICKSVTMIIFVEFLDQLINYPINCASLTRVLQKVLSLGSDYFTATFYQTYFYYKPS